MLNEPSRSMSRLPFDVIERGELIVPCPLVSRGRPTYSSDDALDMAVSARGAPSNGLSIAASDGAPWIAVQAGIGPARLLVSWGVANGGSRLAVERVPSAYIVETSSSSTNGRDGEWRRELSVEANTARVRADVVEYDGQTWVRLTLSSEPTGSALRIEPLDLHDASDGTDDCWLALGDARLGALELSPPQTDGQELRWAELIHARYPGYFPALVDESRLDESPARTLERLGQLLATHSPVRRVAFSYSAASIENVDADAAALDAMVCAVLHSGRLPVLARQPALRGRARDVVDAFNRCITTLERRHGLVPGPDLAAWFDAHPDQLDGDGRPSIEGRRAIARLWADAVDVWYVPQ
jgi:hypothetical protein